MALVQIAHFVDLSEAQVAATALRASGIPALVQNENHGQNFYLLQQALGGFRLWVPYEDAADARVFVETARGQPPEPAEHPRRVKSFLAVVIGLAFGG